MVFSSPVFLFIFLPIVLLGGLLLRKTAGNIFLLIASLVFYAWGEGMNVLILLASICINYSAGIFIGRFRKRSFLFMVIAVVLNILLLGYFKYLNFIIINLHLTQFFHVVDNPGQIFPLGISFFTFQGLSYLIDVHRGDIESQKNPLNFSLYISFFPQLISGPINRFTDIGPQITSRKISMNNITEGLIRFIRGLAKKVIIANTLGVIASHIFDLDTREIPTILAWAGMICYALQIYYDFSGYTDMAIGLAKIFGFEFRENFNYPYVAKSIQEFWQRWHMSLSSWLRDYLFTPLSLKMRSLRSLGLIIAVLATFVICGIWHGPGWHFVAWGLIHGLLIIAEQIKTLRFNKLPVFIRRFYVIIAVMISWVFFKSESLMYALQFLKRLIGLSPGHNYEPLIFINSFTIFVFILALILATPARKMISGFLLARVPMKARNIWVVSRYPFYLFLFLIALMEMALSDFNPFIYFRF